MKKIILLSILLLVAIGVVLTGCGGKEEEEKTTTSIPAPSPQATSPTQTQMPATTKATSDGGATWNDIPVYSGAKQVQKGSWTIPMGDSEDWTKVEWRYYETGGSLNQVTDFYKSKMTENGWTQVSIMELEGVNWGYYTKNNEDNGAMFWISSEEGKTIVALMRASK